MPLGETRNRVHRLRGIPLLHDLDHSYLEQLGESTEWVTRQPGDVLIRQGDIGSELLLLVDGTVRVELDGRVVAEMGPNSVIGEMSLIDNAPRSASVIAVTECTLLVVPYYEFWNFVRRVPAVQRQLLTALSRRVRDLEKRLID